MDGVLNIFNSDTSDSDECNNETNKEINDTDIKIVGYSNSGRSTQSLFMDHMSNKH